MKDRRSCIKSDFRRIFRSPRFYLALGISLAILLRPLEQVVRYKVGGTFLEMLSIPFALSDFMPFAAIFCVLPFADSFCEDYRSGYVRAAALRVGIKRYAWQRCLTVLLSGALLMAAAVGITLLVCAFLTTVPETEESAQFLRHSVWAKMGVLTERQWIMAILRVFLGFLFGGLWALAGLTVSVVMPNRYVTLAAPFAIYQILWFLLEGSAFSPVYMLRGDSNFLPSFQFIVVWQLFLNGLCFLASYTGIKRRLAE